MPPFVYRERPQAAIAARAAKQGGDFQGYIKDEFKFYKVRDGENWIRILPATFQSDPPHYGLNIHVHYRIGPENASVLCLRKMAGGRCPVCEEVVAMERAGDTEAAKDISERLSVLAWIIDRKDEPVGPQLWAMPYTKIDLEIQKQSQDRQTGIYFVVDSPYEGYDIYFDKGGKGLQTQYTGVQLARSPTSVDQLYLDYIAECPVPDTLVWRDYNEVKDLLFGGVAPDEAQVNVRPSTRPPSPRPVETPVRTAAPPRRVVAQPAPAPRVVAPPPRRVAQPAPAQAAPTTGWARPVPVRRAAPQPQPQEQYDEYVADPNDPNAGAPWVDDQGQPYDPAYDPAGEPEPPATYTAPPQPVRGPARPMAPPPSGNVDPAARAADIRNRFGR